MFEKSSNIKMIILSNSKISRQEVRCIIYLQNYYTLPNEIRRWLESIRFTRRMSIFHQEENRQRSLFSFNGRKRKRETFKKCVKTVIISNRWFVFEFCQFVYRVIHFDRIGKKKNTNFALLTKPIYQVWKNFTFSNKKLIAVEEPDF